MSTLKLENIGHPDAAGNALEFGADGSITNTVNFTGPSGTYVTAAGARGLVIDTDQADVTNSTRFIMKNGTNAGALYYHNTLGWVFNTGTNIGSTSGTQRVFFGTNGIVRTPYQPAFTAVDSTEGTYTYGETAGQTYLTSYKDVFPVGPNLAFTQNTGGHAAILPYSQGYYLKFTAPVAGWYMFGCNVVTRNSSTADYWSIGLEVNNTASASTGSLAYYFGHSEGTTAMQNIGGSVQVYLNANDFVVWFSRSADTVTKHQMSNFWGRLVG